MAMPLWSMLWMRFRLFSAQEAEVFPFRNALGRPAQPVQKSEENYCDAGGDKGIEK
jgi:hypothetical protein